MQRANQQRAGRSDTPKASAPLAALGGATSKKKNRLSQQIEARESARARLGRTGMEKNASLSTDCCDSQPNFQKILGGDCSRFDKSIRCQTKRRVSLIARYLN
jgi:hypothetical protein